MIFKYLTILTMKACSMFAHEMDKIYHRSVSYKRLTSHKIPLSVAVITYSVYFEVFVGSRSCFHYLFYAKCIKRPPRWRRSIEFASHAGDLGSILGRVRPKS